ncbi:MAG: EAL domain-containing protein [Betaproteobacteria bacterium]|nr:EAL domain-containing protein [Betaproteobacteria bacterium]
MRFSGRSPGAWLERANRALDAALFGVSAYAVPAAIAAVTVVALAQWERQYDAGEGRALKVQVLETQEVDPPLGELTRQLASKRAVPYYDTHLSERPFWFSFTPMADAETPLAIEFPSRHGHALACWDATSAALLGSADRSGASGAMRAARGGFALDLGRVSPGRPILCRGSFVGPARLSVAQWPAGKLQVAERQFDRDSGLLDGGLVMLALFALLTAMISREWLYVLFAAWLIANLRLAAVSAGWGGFWLERNIPEEWLLLGRKLTIAAYYVLITTLFARLFREDLRRIGQMAPLRALQWSCVPLAIAALALPQAKFLPYLWVTTAFGIAVLVFYMARILAVTRSTVAIWYSASLAVTLLAALYEVIAAALGMKAFIGVFNFVTAALFSSLLATLAIAEQMRQDRKERLRAEVELRHTYEVIPIGLFTLAPDGALERMNPALAQMLGAAPDGPRRYWREYFEAGSWDRLQDAVRAGGGADLEIRGTVEDGVPRWYHVKATLTGERIEGSLQDVTERHQATEQLQFLAENDPLTGVLNRRGVEKIIADATLQAAMGRPLAVAYLDLDRFKLINDLFGHVAGDDVLRQVCRRIERHLAEGQTLGRIGGDEFLIVFRGAPIEAAAAICRGIIDAIGGASFLTGDKAFQVKASIGLVEVAGHLPVKDAIAVADRACRAAKLGAGEGLVVYDRASAIFQERADELRLLERLGTGAAPEGLFLVMQPILSLSAPLDSLNFEVLVRLREPDGSITPAGAVVAAAENNGRAAVIDRWVLANTLAWLEQHHDALAATRFVTMNLSGASLNDERFTQDAYAMLASCPRATGRLCIEVTERVALHDLDNTRRFIDRVRGYGAKVALDDFGAGYTSFSYLKELPADALKIDGSFIVSMIAHPANLAIVEAIVELGRNLGMKSIAEWAEDRATVEALAGLGVDYVQGFAISIPQPPEAILAARSSASFIGDPQLLRYVRETLAPAAALAQMESAPARNPFELH